MAKNKQFGKITLSGYEFTGFIGKGSYSEVYEGIQKVTGEKVAIKVIRKTNLTKGKIDDIVSEIGIMKSLDHNNIVRMLDFKWDEQNVYIILEYCKGGNLAQYIKRLVRLPEDLCKRALQQLASGLAYLRLKEICHMDLKPKNLLIKFKPFTLKIADFGLSQHLNEEVFAENVRGSPLYMAPEILLKHKYNYKVDLWSVGIILYESLFGHAPFSNVNCRQLIGILQRETPITFPTTIPISYDCRNLMEGLLKYDPYERMPFDAFFNHPFIDLVHSPTDDNKKLAKHIVHEAVKYDEQKKYPEAFNTYCRALRYLVPALHSMKESYEWNVMHLKVMQCLSRAEELKVMINQFGSLKENDDRLSESESTTFKGMGNLWKNLFYDDKDKMGNVSPVSSSVENSEEPSCSTNSSEPKKNSTSQQISVSSDYILSNSLSDKNYSENVSNKHFFDTKNLFLSTPKVYDALEIGYSGQMYMIEGEYDLAYQKLEASLSILIPHLKKEPPSHRKDILVRLVQFWLTQAESAKGLLAAKGINSGINDKYKVFEATENCTIQ